MKRFVFELGQKATLAHSGEFGIVIGRAEYLDGENGYRLRYKNGTGCQVEEWHGESAFMLPV